MKNDPRMIYPGANYYGGLTSPFGNSTGMGFNTSPGMASPMAPPTGLTHAPVAGGLNPAPLSNIFGQSTSPMAPGGSVSIR